jgi:hypothetical protein
MQILDGGYTTLRNQSKEELQLKGSGDQTFRQSDVFVLCYVSSGVRLFIASILNCTSYRGVEGTPYTDRGTEVRLSYCKFRST